MSKIAHYLQEHLVGEVINSAEARRYFSNDTSILTLTPQLIVYPKNENDVRKTARFTWQLAERGRLIPITARGMGSDVSGAAIGNGIILVFPAHMSRIVELDAKSGLVTVEPGTNYGKLQQTLYTHGRWLPPFPSSLEYSTIGGALANNASGEKSFKYGTTREYVKRLRVVLANGEVIETGRISKKELNKKLGISSMEGEIYRGLDGLIEEHHDAINAARPLLAHSNAGYALWDVKHKDGSFDLTPLLVGSQGTLGLITEATLSSQPYSNQTTLIAAFSDDIQTAEQAIQELRDLSEPPSVLEIVDGQLLAFADLQNPNLLKGIINKPYPKLVILIEFDSASERQQHRLTKKAIKILDRYEIGHRLETEAEAKELLWKLHHSSSAAWFNGGGRARAVPVVDDAVLPADRLAAYLQAVYGLFKRHNLSVAVWGHAGTGNMHLQPLIDLTALGDRQKVFRLMDEYYNGVLEGGGSISGQHNDGRVRGPYLVKMFGPEIYELFVQTKRLFDPYGTLNPGVKVGVTMESIKPLLRQEYSLQHHYTHLPRL